MKGSIRAVLVDLDGTLVDTLPEIAAAVNATLAEAQKPAVPPSSVAAALGEGAEILLDHLLGHDASARWLSVYLAHYRAMNGTMARIYPGVREGLELMRMHRLGLACVTNKPRELVDPLLTRLGLAPCFDATVGGGDTDRKKPHPAPLLAACERLDIAADACVMIGDSINDARAAREAGMWSLTVPYGYPGSAGEAGSAMALLGKGVTDAVVADLVDAARWIEVLG